VGEVSGEIYSLLVTTLESLYKGIQVAREYNRVGDISNAIQTYCEAKNYSVVREMVGHGIGRDMHEAPEIPNFGKRGTGALIKNGMCFAIEPMINMGSKNVVFEKDGWTVRTKDRQPSAHFEHTVAIQKGKAEILSTFEFIQTNQLF
jgi:methionyl aminopeptidase